MKRHQRQIMSGIVIMAISYGEDTVSGYQYTEEPIQFFHRRGPLLPADYSKGYRYASVSPVMDQVFVTQTFNNSSSIGLCRYRSLTFGDTNAAGFSLGVETTVDFTNDTYRQPSLLNRRAADALSSDWHWLFYGSPYGSTSSAPCKLYERVGASWVEKWSLQDMVFAARFSEDATLLAVLRRNGTLYLIDLDTLSQSTVSAGGGAGDSVYSALAFNPGNTVLAYVSSSGNIIKCFNTSDLSQISITGLGTISPRDCDFSPDGSLLAIAHAVNGPGQTLTLIETTGWTVVNQIVVGSEARCVRWVDNERLLVGTSNRSGTFYAVYLGASAAVDEIINLPYHFNDLLTMELIRYEQPYKIEGTIEEQLAADTWRATAYDVETGEFVAQAVTSGNSFTMPREDTRLVSITVDTYQGEKWTPFTNLAVGDKIIPTSPADVPYYFEVITAGMTDGTEPVWNTQVGGQTTDGTVVYERVERLIQPVTQSPIRPVPA
jgi:WD40 repeat protein